MCFNQSTFLHCPREKGGLLIRMRLGEGDQILLEQMVRGDHLSRGTINFVTVLNKAAISFTDEKSSSRYYTFMIILVIKLYGTLWP